MLFFMYMTKQIGILDELFHIHDHLKMWENKPRVEYESELSLTDESYSLCAPRH